MKTFIFLVISFLVSCGTSQIIGTPFDTKQIPQEISVVNACDGNDDPSCDCENAGDSLSINGAELSDTELLLFVNHGGGCEKHTYKLSACNRVLTSLPPQQDFVLVHDANGDECDKEFMKVLSVPRKAISYIGNLQSINEQKVRMGYKQ